MKIGTWLLITAIVGLLFGLAYLILPAQLLGFFGVMADDAAVLAGRFFGGAILGYGVLAWLARDLEESVSRRVIARTLFVTMALGAILSLVGVLSGVFSAAGWVGVLILLVLALVFGYFGFM